MSLVDARTKEAREITEQGDLDVRSARVRRRHDFDAIDQGAGGRDGLAVLGRGLALGVLLEPLLKVADPLRIDVGEAGMQRDRIVVADAGQLVLKGVALIL
ncbi:hypothetical protein OVA11_19270 [Caulobacter sp. SL161]|uniref:hypothetical protein n=1 Tax=Caulobacter sp. SL161 TaxID=2995156 RepID=UPI002273FFC6|nr:hypothetical protein [Caulobacter sp. SL161]MCY1649120.1 hypothetical protein [Caulobacter sp. SL161]